VGKIVLRLRLLSLALSITEYIAAVRRLIRVGAGELIILGADHDAELRALDRVVLSSTNRPLSKQRISAV
jgi:hypothetical protein